MSTLIKIVLSLFVSLVILSSSASAKACGEVTITEMNWSSSAVITAVAKFLMEQGYGCKVVTVPSATVPSLTSVSETGKPDIVTELWINSAPLYAKLEAKGTVVKAADVLSDGGGEGWWIPKYLADKHPELKTIDNILKNPALVGGTFHNCPDGWGCRFVNDNLKVALNLEKSGMKVFNHGSGETLAASIAAAYAKKEPWFGYYWSPTALLGKYEMVQVDLGAYNAKNHTCNMKKVCNNPGISDFPAAPVYTVVTAEFHKKNPAIFKLTQNIAFTNKVMEKLLAWREKNSASAEETAVYFLSQYKNTWKSWISKSAQKKLSALL